MQIEIERLEEQIDNYVHTSIVNPLVNSPYESESEISKILTQK